MQAQYQIQKILETYGAETANESNKTLLEDPKLRKIKQFLKVVSKTWSDPFTPAMMHLSCKAVQGDPKETQEVAKAMSLMNLSFRTWDDIIDKTLYRKLRPTTVGKLGNDIALIVGGIASARAFTILNQTNIEKSKRQKINELLWIYWAKMAETEITDLKFRSLTYSSVDKFKKIKSEAINLKTCLQAGAILGNGSTEEIQELGKYGYYLGITIELWKDIQASFNMTLELAEKIHGNKIPFIILKAKEESEKFRKFLDSLDKKEIIEPCELKELITRTLQTDALTQTKNLIKKLAKKAEKSLDQLRINEAKETLKLFLTLQVQLVNDFSPYL